MKPQVGPGWFESAGWLFFWRVWERGWISFLFNSSNLSITDSLSLFYFYVSYLYSFQSFSFSEFIECQSPFASITSSLCQVGLALLLSNCAFRLGYFYCNIYLLHNNYKYGNDNMIKVCNQISHLIFAFFSWSNSSSLTVFNIKGVAILFLFKFFFFFLKKIYLLWSLIIIKYFHTCHYYRLW